MTRETLQRAQCRLLLREIHLEILTSVMAIDRCYNQSLDTLFQCPTHRHREWSYRLEESHRELELLHIPQMVDLHRECPVSFLVAPLTSIVLHLSMSLRSVISVLQTLHLPRMIRSESSSIPLSQPRRKIFDNLLLQSVVPLDLADLACIETI